MSYFIIVNDSLIYSAALTNTHTQIGFIATLSRLSSEQSPHGGDSGSVGPAAQSKGCLTATIRTLIDNSDSAQTPTTSHCDQGWCRNQQLIYYFIPLKKSSQTSSYSH